MVKVMKEAWFKQCSNIILLRKKALCEHHKKETSFTTLSKEHRYGRYDTLGERAIKPDDEFNVFHLPHFDQIN